MVKKTLSVTCGLLVVMLLVSTPPSRADLSPSVPVPENAWNVDFMGLFDTPGTARDLAVVESYSYISDSGTGLRINHICDPQAPIEAGFYDTPGAYGVTVVRPYAYVAHVDAGLRIIDISDPHAPFEAGLAQGPTAASLALEATAERPEGVVWYVDWEVTGANDGTSWQDAFVDLQFALDAAKPGDDIWVAAGTYYPSVEHGGSGDRYRSFQMLAEVGIYGGFDPSVGDVDWEDRDWVANVTTLSGDIGTPGQPADNSYHVFFHTSSLNTSAVLDGFVVTEGNANGQSPHSIGGGMFNYGDASPMLTNCTFTRNQAAHGGGMFNYGDASPVLTNCTFTGNLAAYFGGGMVNAAGAKPVLTSCTFTGNLAAWMGGGMSNIGDSSPVLTDCAFTCNGADFGGGMFSFRGAPQLTNCSFTGNYAITAGGGTGDWPLAAPVLTNCTFRANWAGEAGGGMYSAGSPVVTNCTFRSNSAGYDGGGIYTEISRPVLTNCTFTSNVAGAYGGAISSSGSTPVLANCILWGDAPDEIHAASSTVIFSDVQGGYTGEGNIDADPLWVDPANGDLHLGPGSPCIDAGTNDGPNLPPYDFEGDPRILDGDGDGIATVDMGIDEVVPQEMHVQLIHLVPVEPQPGTKLLLGLVRIIDEGYAPVAGAAVDLEWTLASGDTVAQYKSTNDSGPAVAQMLANSDGTYQMCVTNVTADGYLYDPNQNLETCDTITMP